jgi:hypothetical protein
MLVPIEGLVGGEEEGREGDKEEREEAKEVEFEAAEEGPGAEDELL